MDNLGVQTILAVGAGFLLNFTPCVLPAIPLKITAILRETGSTKRERSLAALSFFAGCLGFFLVMGGGIALLHLYWGEWFQSRFFLGALSLFLLAAGSAALLGRSVSLPQLVYRIRGKRYMEPFLSGMLSGLLSTPCTGFFLGGVLAFALTRPPVITLWLFASIGAGFSLPYAVVFVFPGMLEKLPRGGDWTLRIQEIFGFVFLGGALFFLQILLPGSWRLPAWMLWATGLGGWAVFSWVRPGRWPSKVLPPMAATVGITAVLAVFAFPTEASLPWEPFRGTSFEEIRSRGVPALIEFTADWCINCKVLEKTVYTDPGVLQAARETRLAAFRVDLTESDTETERLLSAYGGAGLPFAVVLSRQGEVVERLPDLFSPRSLEHAIRRAGERKDFATMNPSESKPPAPKNRLATEHSPYLLQHAGNPVDWFPWGEEAFARARAENKPIFLSIGYSTCYWCHVMERESFENSEVADRMNRSVIAVKVDREERPDVDGIYMMAVTLMTGRGGWPMSVFLTPDRKPFFGGTYIPKAQFLELLDGVHAAWTNRRPQVLEEAERVSEAIRKGSQLAETSSAALPDPDRIRTAALQYTEMFDNTHAGFGGAPKFPQPAILELLMTRYEDTNDPAILSMVTRTLDAMSRGGIHDQIGGGFHRYSTDAKWLVPHFEKMLYDQAQLLHAYARAFRLSGNEEFHRVCERIAGYLHREMTRGSGLFYSAQDSEVDEKEGKSYLWTSEELQKVLDGQEYSLAVRAFGIGLAPKFEGRYILHWPRSYEQIAKESGMTVPGILQAVDAIGEKLLAARRTRPQPFLDDKSITSWNGLMIEALAYAGEAFREKRLVRMASRAADDLLTTLRDPEGNLLHVARAGSARLPAYLDDYAASILGLVELHRVTGESRWREEAGRLGSAMVEHLREPSGRFRYTDLSVGFLIAESPDTFDGAFPAGNSLAVRALTKLAGIGYPEYRRHAEEILKSFASLLREHSAALPYMLWGLHEFQSVKVSEPGSGKSVPGIPSTAELLQIRGSLSPDRFPPGKPVEISVTLTIENGWHVNANPASFDWLVPTTLVAAVEGMESSFTPRYPPGTTITIGPEKDRISVYENRVVLGGTITTAGTGLKNREGQVAVSVQAQACNETGRCLAPSTINIKLSFYYE